MNEVLDPGAVHRSFLAMCEAESDFANDMAIERLDELFIEWQERQGERKHLHASSLLEGKNHFCPKEHVLEPLFKKVLKDVPLSRLKTFKHGWSVHELYQKVITHEIPEEEARALEKEALTYLQGADNSAYDELIHDKWEYLASSVGRIALEVETEHYLPEYDFVFTPDGLIEMYGVPFVLEIKGYRNEVWQDIMSRDPRKNADFKKAVVQANLYAHLLHIPYIMILIENKAIQKYRVWIYKYNEGMAASYVKRLHKHKQYTRMFQQFGVIPKRICGSIEDERARVCPMRTACFASEEEAERLWKTQELRDEYYQRWEEHVA